MTQDNKGFIHNIKMGFKGFLKTLAIFGVGLLVGCIIYFFISSSNILNTKSKVSLNLVNTKIQEVAELTTLKYKYTQVGKTENFKEFYGITVPGTKSLLIVKVPGELNIGFDFEEVKVESINNNTKAITISMPEVKVLSNTIFEDRIEVLTEQNGLFNQGKIENYATFIEYQKEEAKKEAIDNGVFELARTNSENIIRAFVLEVINDTSYKVEFTY